MEKKILFILLAVSLSFSVTGMCMAQGCGGGPWNGGWDECGYGYGYGLVDRDGDGYCDGTAVPFVDENGNGFHDGYYGFSNGGQIYFTGTNEDCERIPFSIGSRMGGRMGGGMMMRGSVSCALCHGADSRGRKYMMHMFVVETPDIRWSVLSGEHEEEDEHNSDEEDDSHTDEHEGYDLDTFRQAVVEGRHPDGESLSILMPRWHLNDDDSADLAEYLKLVP